MSADILPMFARLERDLTRMGLQTGDRAGVVDLHAERVRREREASERKHHERHGVDSDPKDAA